MTQDIIAIAREAGIKSGDIYKRTVGHMSIETLERFEALVRADEREACALVCINIANKPSNVILGVAIDCAAAIRARSQA